MSFQFFIVPDILELESRICFSLLSVRKRYVLKNINVRFANKQNGYTRDTCLMVIIA